MSEMWKRTEFLLANGMSQLPNSSMTNDISPYECFDGGLDTDIDLDFSDASGKKPRKKKGDKSGFKKVMSYTPMGMAKEGIDRRNSTEGLARRDARRQDRLKGRADKQENKKAQSDAQNQAITDVTKQSDADALLLEQIQQPLAPVTPTPTGMSKGTKISLIVGAVAVAGLLSYFIYKKLKK
jgi:hypothetical protein